MITGVQTYRATWCPVCDCQVSEAARDTNRLLTHVRKHHPRKPSCEFETAHHDQSPRRCPRAFSPKKSTSASYRKAKKSQPKKVYATRVDTWKSHNERKLCPRCQREAVPTLHARGDKLTTSHMGALCLLGCWPLCFIPLMMKRAKRIRMICPVCGYVYGTFKKNGVLKPCETEPADLENRLSSPPNSFRVHAASGHRIRD